MLSKLISRIAVPHASRTLFLHTRLPVLIPTPFRTFSTSFPLLAAAPSAPKKGTTKRTRAPRVTRKTSVRGGTARVAKTTEKAGRKQVAKKKVVRAVGVKKTVKRRVGVKKQKKVVPKTKKKAKKKSTRGVLTLSNRLGRSVKPPKPPPNQFGLYVSQVMKEDGNVTDLPSANERMKEAAQRWRALTPLEKQPYYTESRALREAYATKRREHFANMDPKLLRAYNKARVAKGKKKIHAPPKSPEQRNTNRPFINFLQHYLKTPEGEALVVECRENNVKLVPRLGAASAAKWKTMSPEEKAKFTVHQG